jgi:hypothetical protein
MNTISRAIVCLLSAAVAAFGQSAASSEKIEDPIVGNWIWPNNHRVTVRADGTGESHKGPKMTWRYLKNKEIERKYEVIWDGGINVDAMMLSRDGSKFEGKRLNGSKFVVRRAPAAAK